VIRVNGLDTPWGADDLAAVSQARPDAVLIPKVSSAGDFAPYAQVGAPVWAMIETCAAIFALGALGRASTAAGVGVWVVGVNDLIKEMRCWPGPDRKPLQPALAMSVMAARAHGLAILDGVWNDIADLDGLERECAQGAAFGFDGKSVIHPSHLAGGEPGLLTRCGSGRLGADCGGGLRFAGECGEGRIEGRGTHGRAAASG
jgi:citrate lyase subunit beta/citryl-CoA lyase